MLIFKTLAVISVTASYLRGDGFDGGIGFVGAASVTSTKEVGVGSNESGTHGLKVCLKPQSMTLHSVYQVVISVIYVHLTRDVLDQDALDDSKTDLTSGEYWGSVDVTTSLGGRACYQRYCPPDNPGACSGYPGIEYAAAAASDALGWDKKWSGH